MITSHCGYTDGLRGEDGVAQGRICGLHGQVPEDRGVGLDAIPLLVIVGEVEQLQTEVGPLPLHRLAVQPANEHHLLLKSQQATAVGPLQKNISMSQKSILQPYKNNTINSMLDGSILIPFKNINSL